MFKQSREELRAQYIVGGKSAGRAGMHFSIRARSDGDYLARIDFWRVSKEGSLMVSCMHLDHIGRVTPRTPDGCEECLKLGDTWGPPASVHAMRTRGLLRFVQE